MLEAPCDPGHPVRGRVQDPPGGIGFADEGVAEALDHVVREAGARVVRRRAEAAAELQQRVVERDEERHLQQQRKAARRRVHAALAVKLHLLLAEALAILAVLPLQLGHRRRDLLHRALRADLRHVEGIEGQADRDRDDDDRETEITNERIREDVRFMIGWTRSVFQSVRMSISAPARGHTRRG